MVETVQLSVRIDKEYRKQLRMIAFAEEKTVQDIVTQLVMDYVDNYKKQ